MRSVILDHSHSTMIAIRVSYSENALQRRGVQEDRENGRLRPSERGTQPVTNFSWETRRGIENQLNGHHKDSKPQEYLPYTQYPFEIGGHAILVNVVEDLPGNEKGKGWHYAEAYMDGEIVYEGRWLEGKIDDDMIAKIDERMERAYGIFSGKDVPLVSTDEDIE